MKALKLLKRVEMHITRLFRQRLPGNRHFHNLEHTKGVVKACQIISRHMGIDAGDHALLLMAAWFHDSGYLVKTEGHEQVSKDLARFYLYREGLELAQLERVLDCIEATTMPQRPKTLIQKILCDADLSHLAGGNYLELQKALRKEWSSTLGKIYTDRKWHKENLDFLKSHQYFTTYGKKVLQGRKELNIQKFYGTVASY